MRNFKYTTILQISKSCNWTPKYVNDWLMTHNLVKISPIHQQYRNSAADQDCIARPSADVYSDDKLLTSTFRNIFDASTSLSWALGVDVSVGDVTWPSNIELHLRSRAAICKHPGRHADAFQVGGRRRWPTPQLRWRQRQGRGRLSCAGTAHMQSLFGAGVGVGESHPADASCTEWMFFLPSNVFCGGSKKCRYWKKMF